MRDWEGLVHLKLVLELLKKEKLFVKFFKCEFWLQEIHFLGHMVNSNGIHVDPSKVNMVDDAIIRKERVKPRRVRAIAMTIQSGVRGMMLAAPSKAFKQENILAERLHGLDQQMERKEYESLYFMDRNGFRCPSTLAGVLLLPKVITRRFRRAWLKRCMEGNLKAARNHQKSYAKNRRKPLEYEVGDHVLLKVSPWKGVIHFGTKGKLALEEIWEAALSIRVMNYLLQAIPNDIYNLVDACKNAKEMWQRIKRLMFGSEITSHVRHSRIMDEFDKFATKEGESLESVYERLTTLVNIMDRNNVRPISMSINTKFLNCLQPEWSKYVTIVHHNQNGDNVSYDVLYDSLVQFEPHVLASKTKKAAKNHDPLALISHSNASSSQSHANSSYSPQPYYVTHPSSVVDYDDEYQGGLQGDSQGNKLTTAMMLLARAMVEMLTRMQEGKTGIKGLMQEMEVMKAIRLFSVFRELIPLQAKQIEQMLLVMKDEAGSNLTNKENDFMIDSSYGEDTLEELTVAAVSEVNASSKVHEQVSHVKRKTIIQTTDDDQIDSSIIFDDPFMENNGGTFRHDDEYHDIKMLAFNVQKEAEKQKRLNDELRKQKFLLQQEFETCKDRVKTFESKTIQCSKYKETCEELEHELRTDKNTIERIMKEKD
ncbi:hypothetical protein Tco_0752924 [Tanacetum coccineum]